MMATDPTPSRASSLPQLFWGAQNFHTPQLFWVGLRTSIPHSCFGWGSGLPYPTVVFGWGSQDFHTPQIPCGSELARDSGVSVTMMATDPTPSRASSLPHFFGVFSGLFTPQIPCGEGACSRWPAKQAPAVRQADRISRFCDCCAAEREQAPSPQGSCLAWFRC
jgi:hypothetical protein